MFFNEYPTRNGWKSEQSTSVSKLCNLIYIRLRGNQKRHLSGFILLFYVVFFVITCSGLHHWPLASCTLWPNWHVGSYSGNKACMKQCPYLPSQETKWCCVSCAVLGYSAYLCLWVPHCMLSFSHWWASWNIAVPYSRHVFSCYIFKLL